MTVIVALIVTVLAQAQDAPHRQLPTDRYPVPDFVTDPELRKLLGDGLAEDIRKLFPTAEERDRFLRWAQQAAQKPASQEELMRSFLEHRKASASPPSMSPAALDRLQGLMKRMADHANSRDPAHGPGRSRFPSGDWLNRHAPTASEFLERFWDPKAAFNLQKGVDAGLKRFQSLLEKWDMPDGSSRNPQTGRQNDRAGDPSTGTAGQSQGGEAARQLPSLPGGNLPGAGGESGSTTIVLALGGGALLIAAFYFFRRGNRPQLNPGPVSWPRPTLPTRFETAEQAAEAYRDLARFALQSPITGLSHLEIESAVVQRHPAAADAARALTSGFESLYYEPGSPAPLSPSDATRFLEATSAPRA